MTELHLIVVGIDDAIRTIISDITVLIGMLGTTHILIDEHTRTHLVLRQSHVRRDMVFLEILIDILETTEHAEALHTPQAQIGTMTVDELAIDILCLPVHVVDSIVAVAGVDTYLISEVLADLVAPGKRELVAPGVELATVHGCALRADGELHVLTEVHQHVAVPLMVSIEGDAETLVEEVGIDTEVELIVLIPVHVGVDGRVVLVDRHAVSCGDVGACADDDAAVLVLCIDLHPLPGSGIVTSCQTERGTELQEVDPLDVLLEPWLFTDDPAGTDSRERAPVVLRSELCRSVGTDEELKEVLVGIGVVDTADVRE